MKKLFGCLAAILLLFMMANVAAAGNLALDFLPPAVPSNAVMYPSAAVKGDNDTIDLEGVANTLPAAVLGNAVRAILYQPTTELPSSTRVIFTMTNGKFADSKIHLIDLNGNSVGSTDVITATATGATATFIIGNSAVPANMQLTLSSTVGLATTPDNIKVTMLSPLATAGRAVTLQVTECFDVIGPITGGLTSAISVIKSYQQLAFTVVAGTATIDVEPPSYRTLFTAAPTNQAVGKLTFTDQWFAANIVPPPDFHIDMAAAGVANLAYTVKGAQLSKLRATPVGLYLEADAANSGIIQNFKIVSDTEATATFAVNANAPAWFNGTSDNLNFVVNGTDPLSPQTFYVEGKLDFVDNTAFSDVELPSTVVMTWDINAWQGMATYMWASADQGTDTFIKIFNNGPRDAEVTVDLNTDTGAIKTTNLVVGKIPTGTVGIFWAADIATAAGVPLNSAFAALFTVNSPQPTVTAVCFQKRPGAVDRPIPVYTFNNNLNYRQW